MNFKSATLHAHKQNIEIMQATNHIDEYKKTQSILEGKKKLKINGSLQYWLVLVKKCLIC